MLSEKNWKLESVLRLVLGVFLCLCVGGLLVGLVRGPTDPNAAPSVARIVIGALTFQGAVLVLTWRFLREHGKNWATGFGFRQRPKFAVAYGALVSILFLPTGIAIQSAADVLLTLAGIESNMQQAVRVVRELKSGPGIIAMAVVTVLLAPLAEEFLFRGVLYPAVKQSGYPRVALWGTAVLFAAIHLNLIAFFPLLVMALLLTAVYELTGNLMASIAMHMLFNGINFFRAVFM